MDHGSVMAGGRGLGENTVEKRLGFYIPPTTPSPRPCNLIYIYNSHNGEWASVFDALFKTRRVSAFAFLRGLNVQLLQSINWLTE